jgi:hypothetical protein
MTKLVLPAIRSAVCEWAAGEPLIRRAYLFGSRARGSNRPGGDVDIAVLFRVDAVVRRQCRGDLFSARAFTWADHVETWRDALRIRLGVAVDLQPIWRDDVRVRPGVKRDGVRLYPLPPASPAVFPEPPAPG